MAALVLVAITILTSICCCKSIRCRHGGSEGGKGRFCYCLPEYDGRNCEKKVTNWTENKKASQSSTYARYATADKAIDGLLYRRSMTKKERYPWWRVHLGVILKVRDVQVLPSPPEYHHGYHGIPILWRVMVGVTSTGRYKLCSNDVERHDCKGAVGYLVVISTLLSKSELTYLAFGEVTVYGQRSSPSPCLSNPCCNGGSCKPKDTFFHICVCPPTWSGLNCEGKNWARGQTATVSGPNGTVIAASNTVDGDRDDVMRRGNNMDLCVTTTRDVTSPWWKVELETAIEVIQVYMVTRVESRTTDLLHCDIYVGPHNGTYKKYYDHNRDKITSSGAESYAWFYVWCIPVSIGNTVKIKYTFKHTKFESSFYAILSLCEVEVYGRLLPCGSNPCNNGGSCRRIEDTVSVRSYECSCPVNWNGSNCEDSVPCMSNPCDNGDTCTENGTSYTCIQRNVPDPCASNPCENGGTCKLNDTSYTCACPAAWTGTNCERKKEEKKLSTLTKVLIGGGVVAAGVGTAVAFAACCSSVSCGDVVSKCAGVIAMKTMRQRLAENAAASLGDEEEKEKEEEEEEEYSIWDEVCRSVSSLVYGEEEVGDAVKASASDQL